MYVLFKDRAEAGRMLAEHLRGEAGSGAVVLALPRGGVPVGFEIARALNAELDVMPVRKIGVPGHKELAMGAIASSGALYVERDTMHAASVSQAQFDTVLAQERVELARREALYRGDRPAAQVESRTVLLVDDGMATGASDESGRARAERARPGTHRRGGTRRAFGDRGQLLPDRGRIRLRRQPTFFVSVGQYYEDFGETTDADVRKLLRCAWDREQGQGAQH